MASILAVDDEANVLFFLRKVLTQLGHKVMVAHDGGEAVDLFNNGCNVDLVITDIRMPKLSGAEVAQVIRRSNKAETPIVAITGWYEDIVDRELFDFILQKPFSIESLVDVVGSLTHSF